MKALLFVAALALAACGCATRAVFIKPEGETIELQLVSRMAPLRVELLTVTDSAFIVESSDKLAVASLADVWEIRVPDYQIPTDRKVLALLVPLTLEGAIFGVATAHDRPGWQGGSLLCMAATIGLMFTGGPQTHFSPPFSPKETDMLKLFCRYPQGLSPAQQQTLLECYGQTEFRTLGE